jgi:uncharacterized membrane protein
LTALVLAWAAIGWRIERPGRRPSVSVLMARYRHAWMVELLDREQRIFDAAILQNLRDGTAFFASTCLIAIGGVLALMGNPAPLVEVAAALPGAEGGPLVWQIKLVPTLVLLTSGFLRFVWANRLFGYFSVLIGAIPNDRTAPDARHRATQAAWLNVRAALNFNRGLRAIYFALASLAWLLGPYALGLATLATLLMLWSREFRSTSRDILIADPPPPPAPWTKG